MPSTRLITTISCCASLVALSGVVAAQSTNPDAGLGVGTQLVIRFSVALVLNLILGGALVTLGPRYATNKVTQIQNDPGSAFLWGLLVGIGGPIVCIILIITIIGILVAIPGLLLLAVLSIIGSAVTIVWIGHAFSGRSGGRVSGSAVFLGAVVLAVPESIPVLGNLIATILGFFGLGVVAQSFIESR